MSSKFPVLVLTLAACRFEPAELAPLCDPAIEVCPPGGGSDTANTTTGDDDGDGIQTVTGVTTSTSTAATTDPDPDGETASAPEAPAIESVSLTPGEPLKYAGAIEVEAVALHAEGVRLKFPNAEIELEEGPGGHFHGRIEVHTGLTNGTYEATLTPWRGEVEGEPESRLYTLELPAAGELFLWDTMPDHGLGQVEALRVTASGQVIGFGTLYENGTPRCFLHRRDLGGKYTEADDIRVIFPDKTCVATDLEVDGETLYLLVSMLGGDGPRWRVGVAAWGEEPTILGTGVKGEVAHALALGPSGKTAICGTAPSPFPNDTIDGRVWPLMGAPVELDYIPNPDDPLPDEHLFDETLRGCAFVGERLVAVGDVFGRHEEGMPPQPPKRTRPLILELNGEDGPAWHVDGLGLGNTTQGSISGLAIDGEGRYVTGLHTCGDACEPEGEVRVYEPGGTKIYWQVTLGAGVLPPQDIAWSPAGYLVVASAEVTGDWSSKFLLQAFVPALGKYEPVWSFSKAEIADTHVSHAVAVGPGAVVGGGVGGAGFPALAFLRP